MIHVLRLALIRICALYGKAKRAGFRRLPLSGYQLKLGDFHAHNQGPTGIIFSFCYRSKPSLCWVISTARTGNREVRLGFV